MGLVDTWIPDDNPQLCPFSRKQPDFAIPSPLTTFHFTVDIFPVLLVCSFISVNQGSLHNLASVISAMAGLGALISLFRQLLVLLEYTKPRLTTNVLLLSFKTSIPISIECAPICIPSGLGFLFPASSLAFVLLMVVILSGES